MSNSSPCMEEWKNLYDATVEFKNIRCWDWMWDSDMLGVQNPETGEIGYCCVMGRLGEHFALAAYLGTEGLEGYSRTRSEEDILSNADALHLQKCLMASFEDRDFLQKEDMQVIKTLGLKFRGRDSWPLFRNYRPGYYPWYLSGEEVKYLTIALRQAGDVALRFRNDPEMFSSGKDNQYLVRTAEKGQDGLRWKDAWMESCALEKTQIAATHFDEIHLERIRKAALRRRGIWETDFFYSPECVREKQERPYYPYVILWADRDTGLILNSHMARAEEYMDEYTEQFLELVEDTASLPEEILVKNKDSLRLLEPVASRLGIRLRLVGSLTALDEARSAMFNFFMK